MSRQFNAFRQVDFTGVIFVMNEAAKAGYNAADSAWTNLGQGQPEISQMKGGLARPSQLAIEEDDLEYSPVVGLDGLREAVADFYNQSYRQNCSSQYTAANVCIAPGGRAALTRIAASLGHINLGHFLPDYTAYQELLTNFRLFHPIPILLDPERKYAFGAEELEKEILGRGLGGLLISNPCNPTGKLIFGQELSDWVKKARDLDCAMIFDEFYSHLVWEKQAGSSVSASEFIDDVNVDPVVIVNGLTKNWRLPGYRISWILAPEPIIEAISSAGSFLDGGAARPLQRAALDIMKEQDHQKEIGLVRQHFAEKRTYLLQELRDLGVQVDLEPEGTFYIWGDVRNLPEKYNTGMKFFREALKHQVIVVPGEFFDVDPGGRRSNRSSRFEHHLRFSFGASMDKLRLGVENLKKMLA